MKVILMSIKPQYAKKIIFGSKTVELRRVAPKIQGPYIILIYESSPVKAITAYALIDSITQSSPDEVWKHYSCQAEISKDDFDEYYSGTDKACALHISSAVRLLTPISLAELRNENILSNPPQSYRYVFLTEFENHFHMGIPHIDSSVEK